MAVDNYQYELSFNDQSVKFGRGTPYYVESMQIGDASVEVADSRRPRNDGLMFGRDYKGGRSLTWVGNVIRNGLGRQNLVINDLNELEALWDAEEIRLQPEEVCVLRMLRGKDSRTMRVYGRPRRFTPTTGTTNQGWIPFAMDFQTIDKNYYDDGEQVSAVSMVPDSVGGFPVPFFGSWIAEGAGIGRTQLEVAGNQPAWVTIKLYGPVTGAWVNPEIEIVGAWKARINGELRYDQSLVIDGTPWNRGIRRNDGANWTGKLTPASQRLSNMRINPGAYDVIIRGTDSTLSARAEIYWRDVYSSHTAVA